ncbi:MAG TPA: DUF1501 domain-containing protein [Planctomycetaceae bacterium]|nr:DUF1501 domain-containing protein [Planctomycetaceae bacterium]
MFAPQNRRELLKRAGAGFGSLALAGLLQDEQLLSGAIPSINPLAPRPPHHPERAKAKRVIWLFMNGGPSQVDTWNYRPELEKRDGQELEGFDKNTGFFTAQVGPIMKSPFEFAQHGESGAWVSEIFPNMAKHVDKMAFLHSCHTESNNHSPALFMVNTGLPRMGFPCVGSWVTYGLGSESKDLPAFIVMSDPKGRGLPKGYSQNWGAGFLPSVFQGTWLKPSGDPIDNLNRPEQMSVAQQRRQLDLMRQLNQLHVEQNPGEADLAARIESYELAYRMQTSAPETLDFTQETKATQDLYGIGNPDCDHIARQCLIARRFLERGTRYVQIYSGGMENERSWDGHQDIVKNHAGFAKETDQPIAALLEDLDQRGLLDDTLVIWGGEFGRLPIVQKGGTGRDHNPHCFTVWMAGGGVKGGTSYGITDEIGHKAIEEKVHINDLHATILDLLGLNHEKLTYRYNGRDFRLTDVAGRIVREIIA